MFKVSGGLWPISSETIPSLVGVASTFKARFLISPSPFPRWSLGFQLQAKAQLVTTGIEVFAVDQAGKGKFHTWTWQLLATENDPCPGTYTGSLTWSECLGVTNANKAVVINFSLRKEKQAAN